MDGIHKSGKGIVRVEDLIVCNFVCWPFVWSLWSYQRIPVALLGAHFPVFFLPFLAVLSVFTSPMKLKKPMLFWLAFYLVTLLESHNARWRTYGMDLAISLSAWIICVSVGQRNYDRKKAVNCIRGIGLFVAVSIILERMLRLFSGLLRPLYTTAALDHIKSNGFSGGALTLSGYAGCFIVPGFAALVILQGSGKKNHRF